MKQFYKKIGGNRLGLRMFYASEKHRFYRSRRTGSGVSNNHEPEEKPAFFKKIAKVRELGAFDNICKSNIEKPIHASHYFNCEVYALILDGEIIGGYTINTIEPSWYLDIFSEKEQEYLEQRYSILKNSIVIGNTFMSRVCLVNYRKMFYEHLVHKAVYYGKLSGKDFIIAATKDQAYANFLGSNMETIYKGFATNLKEGQFVWMFRSRIDQFKEALTSFLRNS